MVSGIYNLKIIGCLPTYGPHHAKTWLRAYAKCEDSCAKYHSDLCSPFMHSVVSDDSVRTVKALIRLRGYAGWSGTLPVAYARRHVFVRAQPIRAYANIEYPDQSARIKIYTLIHMGYQGNIFFFVFLFDNKGCGYSLIYSKVIKSIQSWVLSTGSCCTFFRLDIFIVIFFVKRVSLRITKVIHSQS